jgi:hypothetical protein
LFESENKNAKNKIKQYLKLNKAGMSYLSDKKGGLYNIYNFINATNFTFILLSVTNKTNIKYILYKSQL